MKNLIIVPAYNEEDALPSTLESLQILPDEFEILVINDGSRDRTSEIARNISQRSKRKIHVLNLPMNCGIGVAVQSGFLFATKHDHYRYVIQYDGDGQHDARFIPDLVKECDTKNLDFCVGSRFLDAKEGSFQSTIARRIGIRFFVWLINLLSGSRVTDPTSGFRCLGPRAWRFFAQNYPDDYPEPEALFWCVRNNLSVGEIPVEMKPRQGGISSIYHWKAVEYMIKVSLAILIDRLRFKEH